MSAYTTNYANAQKALGMAQVMVWVPAHQVPNFLSAAEASRIEELERALHADDAFRIREMAARNKKVPTPSIPFDTYFECSPYFMKGGKGHKQAMEVYAEYVAATQAYAMIRAEAEVARTTRSITLERKEAECYLAGLKLAVVRRKATNLIQLEQSL